MKKTDKDIIEENEEKKPTTKKKTAKKSENIEMAEIKKEEEEKPKRAKKVKAEKENFGYDALRNEYVDMVKAGIVDPAKVTRSALQNATSVASTFLTTEAVVADIPQKAAPAMPDPGMGGYM